MEVESSTICQDRELRGSDREIHEQLGQMHLIQVRCDRLALDQHSDLVVDLDSVIYLLSLLSDRICCKLWSHLSRINNIVPWNAQERQDYAVLTASSAAIELEF